MRAPPRQVVHFRADGPPTVLFIRVTRCPNARTRAVPGDAETFFPSCASQMEVAGVPMQVPRTPLHVSGGLTNLTLCREAAPPFHWPHWTRAEHEVLPSGLISGLSPSERGKNGGRVLHFQKRRTLEPRGPRPAAAVVLSRGAHDVQCRQATRRPGPGTKAKQAHHRTLILFLPD